MNRHSMNARLANVLRSALCLCLMWTGAAWSQESAPTKPAAVGRDGPGITWQQLSPPQQELLGGMREQWNQLPPGRQVALANGAKRFLGMNANQLREANRRFEQWNTMTDAERAAITEQFAEFRRLAPRDKARIRQNARRFDRMTPEQRQLLRRRFQDLTPEERARAREQLRNRPLPRRQ